MKKVFTVFLFIGLIRVGIAQTPTWAQDIAPIFYANCTACHHVGGLAPFSLITYSSALANADSIDYYVTTKQMPPWVPDPTYTRFAHERLLSTQDINAIHNWIVGGAPMGDTSTAPIPPVYTNGSALGTPSLSMQIPTYTVPLNQTADIYQCFALPTSLPRDMYITAVEIVPGDPAIVHHVLVYEDTTGACLTLQQNSVNAGQGPGYTDFGGVGSPTASLVSGWVPGSQPDYFPANMGVKLYKNATIVLQIHYPYGNAGRSDSTRINLLLVDSVGRQVTMQAVLNYITNIDSTLIIPANTIKTFVEKQQIPYTVDYSLLSVAPHCHLLGQQWISFAVAPTGDTIPFIRINMWNFRWQGFYAFRDLLYLPKGSIMYARCTYNNTTSNPTNPYNPPQTVAEGDATTDEMMLVYFSYLPYEEGDQNISQDTTPLVDITDTATGVNNLQIVVTPQLYDARPNPASGQTLLSYFLPTAGKAEIKIYDLNGQLVDEPQATGVYGFNYVQYNTSRLNSGTYIFSLSINGTTKSKRLVVTN